jgi:hypothetical protein
MVPFFKSKGNFPVGSISAHGANNVNHVYRAGFR